MSDVRATAAWEEAARRLEEGRDRLRHLWEIGDRPAVLRYIAGQESTEDIDEVHRIMSDDAAARRSIEAARLALLGPPVTLGVRRKGSHIHIDTPTPGAVVEPFPAVALGQGEQVSYSRSLTGHRLFLRLAPHASEWIVMVRWATEDGQGPARGEVVELLPVERVERRTGQGDEAHFIVGDGEYLLRAGRILTRLVLRPQGG